MSEIFNISRNTIDLWLKRKAQTGDLKPKSHKPPGNNHKILEWEKFRDFARRHGDKTQEQMAQLWEFVRLMLQRLAIRFIEPKWVL